MRIDPSAWLTFLRQGIAQWDQTASLLPSQRWLVDAMVDALAPERARCVVELGPGVGVMTKPLLARMRPDATLFTIELDPAIHDELVRSVRDPRLVAICGSAEHLTELLAERGCEGEVDAVMSSLGMSMLPPPIRDRIVDAVIDSLAPDGVYVQFGYVHTRFVAFSTERGFVPFDYRTYLGARFAEVRQTAVPRNLPPAWVYESRAPYLPNRRDRDGSDRLRRDRDRRAA